MQPTIFKEGHYSSGDISELCQKKCIWSKIDLYPKQLYELFEIENPELRIRNEKKKLKEFIKIKSSPNIQERGNWIYYPWSGNLIHIVNEADFFKLRTNRNKNLITHEEQLKLYKTVIGVLGLSIGSHIAINLTQQGIGKSIKIADNDILETTNLNRVRTNINDLYIKKTTNVKRQIYQINPYSNIYVFNGINKRSLRNYLNKKPAPQIIFEAIDDFEMKIRLRLEAKKAKIPVVMFSNVGDTVIIDIERFDLNPETPLFNGLLGKIPEEILQKPHIDPNIYAVKMVGKELIPKRALQSVKEIGKSLVGRPQLSGTVIISSGIALYLVKEIICNKSKTKGRYILSLNNLF